MGAQLSSGADRAGGELVGEAVPEGELLRPVQHLLYLGSAGGVEPADRGGEAFGLVQQQRARHNLLDNPRPAGPPPPTVPPGGGGVADGGWEGHTSELQSSRRLR